MKTRLAGDSGAIEDAAERDDLLTAWKLVPSTAVHARDTNVCLHRYLGELLRNLSIPTAFLHTGSSTVHFDGRYLTTPHFNHT